MEAGESYDFGAEAIYKRRTIVSSDDCYTWTVNGNIGTIDENGLFTASSNASNSGVITATAGDTSVSITVNVVGRGVSLETFEGDDFIVDSGDFVAYTNDQLAYVHNGFKSLAMTYQYETTTDAALTLHAPVDVRFDKAPGAVNFWVYGDNSGNELSLTVDALEGETTISAGTLNFTGWKQIHLILPEGTEELLSLDLTRNGALSGTIYVDHMMATYGDYLDHVAPTVTLEADGGTITGYVSDNMDIAIDAEDMTLTMDGTPVRFTYHDGILNATVDISDNKTHRVALSVTDVSGNLARKAITIEAPQIEVEVEGTPEVPAEGEVLEPVTVSGDGTPFVDTVNHWSNIFDVYLYNQNIASGTPEGDLLMFQPDTNITRMEFAIIVVKWLGLDLEEYSHVQLNFADKSKIPSWAEPYVKAAYGSGMISGSLNNGKLFFNPQNNLTRQEAMTVIGKTQPRGYEEVELNFHDSDKVAFWAEPYVNPLVGLGVISGSNGYLMPTSYLTKAQIAAIIFNLN